VGSASGVETASPHFAVKCSNATILLDARDRNPILTILTIFHDPRLSASRTRTDESVESAYGAGANGHDTAGAIKSEIYNNINIIIYNIFTAYITDTKVGQAKKKRSEVLG